MERCAVRTHMGKTGCMDPYALRFCTSSFVHLLCICTYFCAFFVLLIFVYIYFYTPIFVLLLLYAIFTIDV